MTGSKRAKTAYWIFTSLFCLMMGFTVYAQLFLPRSPRSSATSASRTISGSSFAGPSWRACWS